MVDHDILRVQMYKAAVHAIVWQPSKFTDGMECAICHKKHTFADCPILKDIEYLRKHFISYCLLMNKTQKQMVAAIINKIDASWATDDNTADTPEDDYSPADTDNDKDFY